MLNHAYAHTRNFYNTFLGKKLKLVHAINSDSKVGGWFGVLGNTMHGVYMVCFVRWYRVKYFHVTVAMFVYTKCIVVIDRQCFHIAVHEHRQLFISTVCFFATYTHEKSSMHTMFEDLPMVMHSDVKNTESQSSQCILCTPTWQP